MKKAVPGTPLRSNPAMVLRVERAGQADGHLPEGILRRLKRLAAKCHQPAQFSADQTGCAHNNGAAAGHVGNLDFLQDRW